MFSMHLYVNYSSVNHRKNLIIKNMLSCGYGGCDYCKKYKGITWHSRWIMLIFNMTNFKTAPNKKVFFGKVNFDQNI